MFPEDNNFLRRKLFKKYPKVIYNDIDYMILIERYNSIEYEDEYEDDKDDDFDIDDVC